MASSENFNPEPPRLPLLPARPLKRSIDFPAGSRPVLHSDLLLYREGESLIVASPGSGSEGRLNPTAAFLLSLCGQGNSVAEIARQFAIRHQLPDLQALQDVRSILRAFAKLGAISSI